MRRCSAALLAVSFCLMVSGALCQESQEVPERHQDRTTSSWVVDDYIPQGYEEYDDSFEDESGLDTFGPVDSEVRTYQRSWGFQSRSTGYRGETQLDYYGHAENTAGGGWWIVQPEGSRSREVHFSVDYRRFTRILTEENNMQQGLIYRQRTMVDDMISKTTHLVIPYRLMVHKYSQNTTQSAELASAGNQE